MAILELRFHDINTYVGKKDTTSPGTLILTSNQQDAGVVKTSTTSSAIYMKGSNKEVNQYEFYIEKFDFTKQLYEPNEIITNIFVYPLTTDKGPEEWHAIMKDELVNTFTNCKVSLYSVEGKENDDYNEIVSDYFVAEVMPHYKSDSMYITFKIYSPDKKIAVVQKSCTFVAKKLCEEIIKNELQNIEDPYDLVNKQLREEEKQIDADSSLKDDERKIKKDKINEQKHRINIDWCNNMKVLAYKASNGTATEHIFPYLVQYNESLHDMLKRTSNRWGEFMYYEDGKLNLGYEYDKAKVTKCADWTEMNYGELKDGLGEEVAEKYVTEASYDDTVINGKIKKSPNVVSGQLTCGLDYGFDKWIMRQFPKYFSNTKNVPTMISNIVFDNLYDLGVAKQVKYKLDKDFDEQYFNGNTPAEQYGYVDSPTEYNPFSELNSKFKEKRYREILTRELFASKDAVFLNYDTTYPGLKLGQVISVFEKEYLVIKIECITKPKRLIVEHNINVVEASELPMLVFQVTAIRKNTDDDIFYPTIGTFGHIRTSGPQVATVTDATDPLNKNRVRILFNGWQHNPKDEKGEDVEITDDMIKKSSPWITCASSTATKGNGILGMHYQGDQVVVNFAHGNVERPYIAGGLSQKGTKVPGVLVDRDLVLTSPAGHALRLEDGSGGGLTAFLSGTITPAYDMLATLVPDTAGFDFFSSIKESKNFDGGFQLTDKYGIYKITGSTTERNITVSSPWGDVNMSAFTGITISAPNGDISIKGKNVSIQAGNNLELISGTNVGRKLYEHTDTNAGSFSEILIDIVAAVEKKLASKLEIIDLSFVRSLVEVLLYPVEGAMTVRSNRFLKLEAGKGKCDYPATAYKDQATIDRMNKKIEEDNLRPGLPISAGIVELIQKVGSIADDIDAEYKRLYNDCVTKLLRQNGLKQEIAKHKIYKDDYRTNRNNPYTQSLSQIVDNIWNNPSNELTEANIFEGNNFKADSVDDLSGYYVNRYARAAGIEELNEEAKKQRALEYRKRCRSSIVNKANELRKSIVALNDFINKKSWTRLEMTKKIGRFNTSYVPSNYKDAMTAAFSKEKLGDTIYYMAKAGRLKDFKNSLNNDSLKDELKALKRKAATLLIEGLGFKDEWRSQVTVPAAGNQPEQTITVNRKFDEEDIKNDTYWGNYVRSITSVPKLSPTEAYSVRVKKSLLDDAKKAIDWEDIQWFRHPKNANWSWGEGKNGGILFNYKGHTYSLAQNITQIEGAAKENLTTDDDNEAVGNGVNQFLNSIRQALNSLTQVQIQAPAE